MIGISALELGRKPGVNGDTAWQLKHRLMQAMRDRDRGHRLASTMQVDDVYLSGEHPGSNSGCEKAGLTWVNTILANVKRSLDETYRALAPHYLARHVAEIQYRFTRRDDLAALPQRLLRAAAPLPLPRPILMSVA